MMKRLIIAAALFSTPAMASPAYLSCRVPKQPEYELQITADEPNSQVTIFVVNTGMSQRMAAVFGPKDLRFSDRMIAYRVDRETLDFERFIKVLNQSDAGKCVVRQALKRAF